MTNPLNFTNHALTDFAKIREALSEVDRAGLDNLGGLLRRAQVFALPDGAELMDRSKPRPEVPTATFSPPFPIVALEYNAAEKMWDDEFSATRCPKRIALAWEAEGGTAIASISFFEELGIWMPVCAAAIISPEAQYVSGPVDNVAKAMIGSGRISAKTAEQPRLSIDGWIPVLPEVGAQMAAKFGPSGARDSIASDLMDEINAYLDLTLALACNNVETRLVEQPTKLNKSRIRKGHLPLKDFHVLHLRASAEGEGFWGSGSGKRSHLRRGHIRRLKEDRVTWVNSCMVRGSRAGMVDKVYDVREVV